MKKTKIVCTMGSNTNDREMMRKLIQNGMNVARFNFSHGDHEEQKFKKDMLQELREEEHTNTAILLDTRNGNSFRNPERRKEDYFKRRRNLHSDNRRYRRR